MINYQRVIPRDLFNESKLLKCLGRLSLICLDGFDDNKTQLDVAIMHEDDTQPFLIGQSQDDGNFYCANINVQVKGQDVQHFTRLNSREPYPFYVVVDDEELKVFDDLGNFSEEFKELF